MNRASASASPLIRGTVTLVALCFTAVMGITLAGYIAVCSRAMNLSNRTFQNNLSKQLAETGIDEALRAFNKNDWSGWASNPTNVTGGTTAWTLDTTNKRATRTITFDTGKLGQGITGTIKLRIDNYDANQLDSTWSSSANYRVNNLVGYSGIWYRCLVPNSNKTPSSSPGAIFWMQEQVPISTAWIDTTAYSVGNMVTYNNTWYRCTNVHTSSVSNRPPNGSYWLSIPYYTADADLYYANESLVNYYGVWWRYMTATGWDSAPPITWRWASTQPYVLNDTICYNYVWYRCIFAHTNIVPTNATYWSSASTLSAAAGAARPWSASQAYNLNDVVYRSGSWYRCILAHINQGPPNATYWSTAPLLSRDWDSVRQYSLNDTVRYQGVRYISIHNGTLNIAQNPATATSYWIGSNTATASYQWSTTTAYAAGVYKCYGGVWYKCTTANTGQSPNNTSYWTATWAQGSGVTSGSSVAYAEGTIAITGSPSITTQLRATIAPAPLFPNALAATSTLSIGGGGTVDSYDSTVGTYNVGGNIGYSAVLASTGTTQPAVTVTSTTVKGYVAAPSASTTPYAPMWSYGGSVVLTGSGSSGIDLTRVSRSPYVPQFNIQSVAGGTLLSLGASTTPIGTPGAATPSYYYYPADLRIGGGKTLNIIGPVILDVQGEFRVDNTGVIVIPATGSAEIHFSTRLRIDNGAGGVDNQTRDPKKLILIGTATGGMGHNFSSNTYPFYGVIYMPDSTTALTIDTGVTIYGAISAKNITFTSEANVHYDTSLRYTTISGVDQPWAITQWRELPLTEQATMP